MDFKTMKIDDIINWCVANNQVEWLKAEAQKKTTRKVYPKITQDGKKVTDKTQTPTIIEQPITFIEIKKDFVDKFMPEIAPKAKEAKPTMYEKIAAL